MSSSFLLLSASPSKNFCPDLRQTVLFSTQQCLPREKSSLEAASLPVSEWQQAVLPFRRALGFSCRQMSAGTTPGVFGPHSSCKGAENTAWVEPGRSAQLVQCLPEGLLGSSGLCLFLERQRDNHSTGLRALQGGGLWGHLQKDLWPPKKTSSMWRSSLGWPNRLQLTAGTSHSPPSTLTPVAQLFAP